MGSAAFWATRVNSASLIFTVRCVRSLLACATCVFCMAAAIAGAASGSRWLCRLRLRLCVLRCMMSCLLVFPALPGAACPCMQDQLLDRRGQLPTATLRLMYCQLKTCLFRSPAADTTPCSG